MKCLYRLIGPLGLIIALLAPVGCRSSHRVIVEPVEVKPIHITIDVNVRVERALDDFFGDLDGKSAAAKPAPSANEQGDAK